MGASPRGRSVGAVRRRRRRRQRWQQQTEDEDGGEQAAENSFSDQPATAGRAGSSEGLAQRAPDQVLSDEEVAWRLHQELNATSPILRTRSRKLPDQFGQPKSSSGAGSGSLDGIPSKSRTGVAGSAARTRSVNKAPLLGPASAAGARDGAEEAHLVADSAAVEGEAEPAKAAGPAAVSVEAGRQTGLMERDGDEEPGRRSPFARAAAQAFGPSEEDARSVKEEVMEDVPASVAAAAGQPSEPGTGDKHSVESSPAGPPTVPEAARDAPMAVQHNGSSPSSAAQQGTSTSDGAALVERAGGVRGEASSAENPAAAAGAVPAVTRRRKGGAERGAAPAAAQQQQAAVVKQEEQPAAPVAAAVKGRARGRLPKIPKLPMVRQDDSGWYRARLLEDAGERVLLEFTGFEGQFVPMWLPRTSDRIWRGSYKGKDWKHLGGGAWEPKVKSSSGRRGRGGKRKRDAALSSGPVGPSQEDSQEHEEESDDEGFDEAESGHPAEPQAEQPEQQAQQAIEPRRAASRPGVKSEPSAAAAPKEEEPQQPQRLGSGRGRGRGGKKGVPTQRPQHAQRHQEGDDQQQQQQQQQQQAQEQQPEEKGEMGEGREEPAAAVEEVAEMDVDEKEPPKKKAKRSMGRKRLDPIVRDALLAMDQGPSTEENSEEPAGPSNPREQAQSTPPAWKGSWKQHQRMAVQALEDAVMAEVEQQQQQPGQPHLTPTPETPVTRLGKRSSLTPGAFAPLSPRAAAAAAAAAIDAAGPASPRQRGGGAAEAPLSPRARQRAQQGAEAPAAQSVVSPRAAASAAAQEQVDEPGDEQAPLSPRHRLKSSDTAAAAAAEGPEREVGDLPYSPRQPPGHHHRRQRSLKHAAATTAVAGASSAKASEEEGESGDVPAAEEVSRAAAGGGGRGRRGRRAPQRAVVEQPAESGSDEGGVAAAEHEGTGSESQDEAAAPKARPRRQPRKAAIYKDEDFAFGEEAEQELVVAATAALALEPAGVPAGDAPAQPVRRRRKPLVCSPAPLDVGLPELGSGARKALPAALAALDVLPVPPAVVAAEGAVAVTAAADEHFGRRPGVCSAAEECAPAGQEEGQGAVGAAMAAAIGALDGPADEEAAAVAALADLPSPRAALAQQAQQEAQQAAQRYRAQQVVHRAAQALEEEEEEALAVEADDGEGGAEDDGDDDYAPPPRRREGLLEAPHHSSGALRKRSLTLPMSLDHVRGGRVHKLHNGSGSGGVVPLSRHYSLSHADRQHSISGKRAGHHSGSGHGHGQGPGTYPRHSSHQKLHYWGSGGGMHHKANGSDARGHFGYRRSGALDRAGSVGLPACLEGLTVAQGMFGTILSALKKFSLDDGGVCGSGSGSGALNGYASGGGGANGGARRGNESGGAGLEWSGGKGGGGGGFSHHHHRSGSGGGGNKRQQLHLFSSAWSYSKWHSGGEPHPSILTIQPDLFSKVCGANGGSAALFSLGLPSSAVIPDMHCAAPKPPLPLFC
ncbi:hypothetical protein N2152v2_002912 [Parachlorella kessleri]